MPENTTPKSPLTITEKELEMLGYDFYFCKKRGTTLAVKWSYPENFPTYISHFGKVFTLCHREVKK